MARAPVDESDDALLRLAQGLRLAGMGPPAPVARSPRLAVAFRGKARLYWYPPAGEPRLRTPLVLFPYLGISRPYIFDLRPGESFAEFLSASGVSFYLCDWGVFGPEDRDMGLDTVIADMIPALLRQALAHAGATQATLFGYCMGGPMTAAALAARPSLPVKNLLEMVGPIDFATGEFTRITAAGQFDVDGVVETFDLMPAEFIQAGFKLLHPMQDAQLNATLLQNAGNREWLEGYRAMNRWSNEWVPLPKQFFREWVQHFYRGNELVQGKFRVAGEPVDLRAIEIPLLCIGATNDDIVPVASARALVDCVSSKDRRFLELPGGHISVIAGRRAKQQVWPSVLEWLQQHD
jgi:polyhydroxyalkanoate synthase